MKNQIISVIKFIHNFLIEKQFFLNFSCLIIGILYSTIAISQIEYNTITLIFSAISGVFFSIWIISAKNVKTVYGIITEIIALILFVVCFIYSLNFLINLLHKTHGLNLFAHSILSSVELFYCCVYLLLKFNIILNYFKKIINKVKITIFTFQDNKQSPFKIFLQNITAIFIAIGSLIVAFKGIIEPIITLITNNG